MPVADYIVTIGLEVHVQLKTHSKIFCGCGVAYGVEANSRCCPVCLGLPGALPVINEKAIELTILTGRMLDCRTPPVSKWDRKNYYYPDMPKNYQISQFDLPLCEGGGVPLYDFAYPKDAQKSIPNPGKTINLTRIHLEEDVAKSTHHAQSTTIDFNRAGTPLMEIVSEPEIETAEEAFAYLTSLRQILTYGKVSDADMEKGQMRCDVNISLRKKKSDPLGAKIELKNLNSVSGVRRGIAYEIIRQAKALDAGETLIQSTRRWDDDQGETQLMRTKEDAHDYRYFPDPDLLPIETGAIIERVLSRVPELPHQKCARFEKDFGISAYDASVLSSDPLLADFFEKTAAGVSKPKLAANWIINDLLSALNEKETNIEHCSLEADKLGRLIKLVEDGKISNNQAKEVFVDLFATGKDPEAIVKEKGMEQVSDTGALDAFISQVIEENPKVVEDIKGGNPKPINFLKGQVMKLSKGKANPKVVGEMLEKKLLN